MTKAMKTTKTKRMNRISVLKIDKDRLVDRSWIRDYVYVILAVCRLNHAKVNSIQMCRSTNKGLHFYIEIQPSLLAESANRLQWLLGDDCLRVDYNRARIRSGYPDWNKLFEKIGGRFHTLYRIKVPAGTRTTKKGGISKN
jgi:hypothetical protein